MQSSNKYFKFRVGILGLFIILISCNKQEKINLEEESTIYMPQALDSKSNISLIIADTIQPVTFGAAYGGLLFPSQDIKVDFKLDTTLIEKYNIDNFSAFKPLPLGVYTISDLTTNIRSGSTSSDPLFINVNTKNLPKDSTYLMPVTMTNISSGILNEKLQTAYFKIKIVRKETDITALGTLSVSKDNSGGTNAGEGSSRLIDNDINTKFLVFDFPPGLWMQLKFSTSQTIGAYTLTSGDDAEKRDPKDWRLLGSNDGNTWEELDKRVGQTFSSRKQTVQYEFNNDKTFTYYRLQIDANNGDGLFQISEWRVISFK